MATTAELIGAVWLELHLGLGFSFQPIAAMLLQRNFVCMDFCVDASQSTNYAPALCLRG